MRITCYPDKSYPDTCIQTLVYRPLIPSIIVSLQLWTGKSQWHKFPKWLKTSVSRQLISRHLFPDTCFQKESRRLFPDTCFQQESRHLFPNTCFLEPYPDTCFLTPVSPQKIRHLFPDTCFQKPYPDTCFPKTKSRHLFTGFCLFPKKNQCPNIFSWLLK